MGARIRFVAAVALGASLLFLVAWPVMAAQIVMTSAGPLTQVIVSDTLNCQVAHRDDSDLELYGDENGACGTFLAVGGTVFGPSDVPQGNVGQTPWTPVSQALVTGGGSSGDPLRIVTVVEAAGTGLRISQVDSYVVGSQSYRTDMTISNASAVAQNSILYRAGDCFLQESDQGFGRVDGGAPACIVDPQEGQRIEQWLPITGGSHWMEGPFEEVWSAIASQQQFPDRCDCSVFVDNGAGLSWGVDVGAGQSVVVSHETFFSPQGRAVVAVPFKDSVPSPTQISLDPIVIAQSVAVTAGVILLVPFPSALFNSTLEENYDEVMAGIHRMRVWLARQFAAFREWIKRKLNERRAPPVAPMAAAAPEVPAMGISEPQAEAAEPVLAQPLATEIGDPADAVSRQDVWRTPLGILAFIGLSALLYCFLDPTFGISLASVATFLGLAIGLFVVLVAYGLPQVLFGRSINLQLIVRALPVTLIVGAACVLISRLASFQPGYLYGLVVGFFFVTVMTREQEGRASALAAGTSLVVAMIAWIALAFVRGGATDGTDFLNSVLQSATVTIVVAGLENAVFALLPLRFLPGDAVFKWNRRVWIVLMAAGLFSFAHVLLNPTAGYLADSTRTSFFTLVALLVLFAVASVAFWAYFRFRPSKHQPETAI